MGIKFFGGKEQSLGEKREIDDDLPCVIFVKPLRFEESYFNLRGGGGKKSN